MKLNIQDFIENKMSPEEEDELLRMLHTKKLKKAQLKQWRDEKRSVNLWSIKRVILAVAAACLFLISSVLYWKSVATSTPQYQDFLADCQRDIPKLSTVQMGTAQEILLARKQAELAYSQQKFGEALPYYLQVLKSETTTLPADYFYLGVCYMHTTPAQYEQAILCFRQVRSLDAGFKKQELAYQLGLCYAFLEKFNEARQEFVPIREANGLTEKVEKLLSILPK